MELDFSSGGRWSGCGTFRGRDGSEELRAGETYDVELRLCVRAECAAYEVPLMMLRPARIPYSAEGLAKNWKLEGKADA